MKSKLLFAFLAAIAVITDIQAQQSFPHKGTWHYQNGNQIFVVSIWDEVQNGQTVVLGHYKMITVDANGNQTGVVYNSRKYWGNTTTYYPYAIYIGTYEGMEQSGIIKDNTVNNQRGFIKGTVIMAIQPNSSPLMLHWTVEKGPDEVYDTGEPDFNIPTDIILTKVSNTINLD